MAEKQRILIVDDDANIAELISLYLMKECYETMIVGDGEEALKRFPDFKPNLVILDVGEDVTRFIAETVPVLKAEAEYLQLVIYLKTLKGILDGGFGSYPEAQARICRFVQEHQVLARRPWAKRADRIKVETLLISKRLFYAVYGLGEWKNKHTVEK